MYRYDSMTIKSCKNVAQFRDQVRRRIANELTEDEFQHIASCKMVYTCNVTPTCCEWPCLYGLLSSTQLRKFAFIARPL